MKLKIILCVILMSLFCGCGKNSDTAKDEPVTHIDHGEIPTESEEEETTEVTSQLTTLETTTQETTEEETEEETREESETETSTQARALETTTKAVSAPVVKKQTNIKADISYKGVDIRLGDNADDVASRLELVATSSNISKSDGSRIYSYDGVNLCASAQKNKYYINKVEITNPDITTAAGMGVGKTVDDLQRVYGTETRREGSLYRYDTSSDRYMYFIVQEGKVTSWGIALL
jgi:hypothetical protein